MQPDQVTEGEYRVITQPRPDAVISDTKIYLNPMTAYCEIADMQNAPFQRS
jgi:hypothetical protein